MSRKDTRGVRERRIAAQEEGRKLASQLKAGDIVSVQARNDPDQLYFVGRCIEGGVTDESPIVQKVPPGKRTVKVNKTAFSPGDYVVAVKWFDRDPADSEGQTFIDRPTPQNEDGDAIPELDVFNSTELRCIKPKPDECTKVYESRASRHHDSERHFKVSDLWEREILSACW